LASVTSSGLVWGLVTLILAATAFVWLPGLLFITASPPRHEQLARETERAIPGLMDRLHTLLFLNPRRHLQQVESYAGRIEQQSTLVVGTTKTSEPVIRRDSLRWIAIWLALTFVTLLFYQWFRPFSKIGLAATLPVNSEESTNLELPPVAPQEKEKLPAENSEPWIETRILEPGQDIVVTRFETVRLLVEAATSSELSRIDLHTHHDGKALPQRELTIGSDRHFARQEELLDLPKLGAKDWDVVGYHSAAANIDGMKAESRMNFVDVRPTQEEIEQLPGGAEGEAYRLLSELTGIVDAQKDAIQAVHQLNQSIHDEKSEQELSDLAQAEEVMKTAAKHVGDSLPESETLSPAIAKLRQAAESFQKSAEQFHAEDAELGEQTAQQALGQLAAARREIHNAVKLDPNALPSPPISSDAQADLAEQLEEFNRKQEQLRTAAEQAAQLAEEQRQLAEQIKPCDNAVHRQAAESQRQLRERFDEFRRRQSQACKSTAGQCDKAGSALATSSEALDKLAAKHENAAHQAANRTATESADALKQLANSLGQQSVSQQNSAARGLQRALEEQIQFLENVEKKTQGVTEQQLEQAARNMQATTSELEKMANDPQTRQQFSDQLREELSPEKKKQLDGQCQGICNNPGSGGRKQAARAAKAGLARVSQAMQSGRPGPMRRPAATDPLATDAAQALARARQQLESFLRGAQAGGARPSYQRPLLRDALRHLQTGNAPAGRGAPPNDLVAALQDQLKDARAPIDFEQLRRLLAMLEQVQVEQTVRHDLNEKPDVTNLDSQNYPPGYRDWIQRYYRRLAEQP